MLGHPTATLALSLWIGLSGCTGQPERAHAAAPTSTVDALQLGAPVPDVPLTLQDGFQLRLPAMKGKLIAVFFCASLEDPSCRREAETLAEHHSELHDEHHVVIIGVSPASTEANKALLAAQHWPLDLASDPDRRVARAFGLQNPLEDLRMVVVGRDANIRAVWSGADPEQHVRALRAAASE